MDRPVAVVTGAAQGIGQAIADSFLEEGYGVVALDIDATALAEWSARHASDSLCTLSLDVADEKSQTLLGSFLAEQHLSVRVLVNNAGIMARCPLDELNLELFDRVWAVHVRGALLMTRAVLGRMPTGGSIINIVSTRALMSEPDTEAYSAAKGGLLSLTHAMAISLGARGVRVNALSPGWIDVSDRKAAAHRRTVHLSPADHAQHPAGRVGRGEDVAAACLFLASEQASFITGANLVVDGGMTRKMIYLEDDPGA